MTTIRIYAGNKEVGAVKGNVFEKHVQASKHFLRTPQAIAIDIGTLMQAKTNGAEYVHIIETEQDRNYWAPITLITKKGLPIDRGFGRQLALEMHYWDKTQPGAKPEEQPKLFT